MTHAGFLRAIIDDPASDMHRLVYADWLEERGDPERAEFIRVQCELAEWQGYSETCTCAGIDEYHSLRRRELELLHQHGPEWADELWPAKNYSWHPIEGGCLSADAGVELLFRRGFVYQIHCTLADWCGAECKQCRGRGSYRS